MPDLTPINHTVYYPSLRCPHCECRFILIAAPTDDTILTQASSDYCPHCGRAMNTATNLATTIPPDQITHGQGEPVFPTLYEWLRDFPALLELAKQREQYGIAKYGQSLMTGDDRDTATEIINEMVDMLAYMQKHVMQHGDDYMESLLAEAILLCDDALYILTEEISDPWTQAEIDAAKAKVPALRAALGIVPQCTCKPTCLSDCKGQCGCEACHEAYMDFLSVE